MDISFLPEEFELISQSDIPTYPIHRNFPTLHPRLPPIFEETKCHIQPINCHGRRYGNALEIQFVLTPNSERHIPLNNGWRTITSLANKYNKDPSVIRKKSKKRCLIARSQPDKVDTEMDIFYGIDLEFLPVKIEPAVIATFDVFFYSSSTTARLECLYVPNIDKMLVLETQYSRPNEEPKKLLLTGELRERILQKVARQCAHKISNHEFKLF